MEKKKINIELHEDLQRKASVVTLSGKLDLFSFKELKNFFSELEKKGQALRVVIDLSGVEFVASSGWSVLLARRKMSKLAGGELVVHSLKEEPSRVYQSMKIFELLPLAEDEKAAFEKLGDPPA